MATYHLIDTHCHFNFPPFIDEWDEALHQISVCGVERLIIPAVDIQSSKELLPLIDNQTTLYGALGLHPIYQHHPSDIDTLESLLLTDSPSIVAIGEVGLDGFKSAMSMDEQIPFLTSQIDLANRFHLPLILHSRRTHSEIHRLLKQNDKAKQGVIHGFSGSYEEAKQFIKLGYYIGVGGVITYPRANKTREAIRQIPIESIVLETDAPDMPLNGFQGEPNRPERLPLILNVLAELRGESALQLSEQIYKNTHNLFPKLGLK